MKRGLAASLPILLTCAAISLPGAARAAGTDHQADLRCLAGFAVAAGSSDTGQKSSAVMGVIYFLGRLDAEVPGFDLQTELQQLMTGPSAAQVQADMGHCGALLQQRGQELQTIGKALSGSGSTPAQ